MMVQPLNPLFGTKEVGLSCARFRLGYTRIWPRFPALLVSCAGLGLRSMVGASRLLMSRPGHVASVCSVGFFSSLATVHWPADARDLGHHGVSYLEVLIVYEQWAGHRLLMEKVTRPHVRAHRPISISSVSVSEGIEIRQGCRFISGLIRALGRLLCGLRRFLPCFVGRPFFPHEAPGVGSVLSWTCFYAPGNLSPSVPESSLWVIGFSGWCGCGAFGCFLKSSVTAPPTSLEGFTLGHFLEQVVWYLVVFWVMRVVMVSLILAMEVALRLRVSGQPGSPIPYTRFTPGQIQGFQRQSDGKGCILLDPQDSGVRPACQTSLFVALRLVEFAAGDAWNLHP